MKRYATDTYDEQNRMCAGIVLDSPERYPELVEWAYRFQARERAELSRRRDKLLPLLRGAA